MARQRHAKLVDDSGWKEVVFVNRYALLMGYLSMAVKGLGFLVLTWTTVVLLGGFVSTLQKKDFWCLTFITLVQTAGIFDVFLTEKLSYIGDSFWGVMSVGYAVVSSNPFQLKCHGLGDAAAMVQVLVFVILLCPLAAVYMFGLLISAGISVWRLRLRDYGSNADGVENLKPALDILYSLALLQGVVFCYKTIFGFAKGSVVDTIIEHRGFGDQTRLPIRNYLLETLMGCEKDPSFARGRNLITYAVDLMRSKSPDDYLSGVRILDAFARSMERVAKEWEEESYIYSPKTLKRFMQEHILMKHLIMSASSTDILQKLLQTLGYRSIYDRETRECAARIVANIAEGISLEQFPGGIRYISSPIDAFREYQLLQPYQRDWVYETFDQDYHVVAHNLALSNRDKQEDSDHDLMDAYKELVVQALRILRKLAINNDNCRIILDAPSLLPKIMAPVNSDLLHHIDHGAWYSIVEGSLKVMAELTTASGETGMKLRTEISSSREAISAMERILECDKCSEKLQKLVIWNLTHLYKDTSLILETATREKFIEMLVHIMTDDNKDMRVEAAEALVALSYKIDRSAMVIMKANDNVVDSLTKMIVEKRGYRLTAARILEYLCIHYTNDDESLKKLQKAMTIAVPKILGDIVCWASEETHEGTEVDQVGLLKPETDVESQYVNSQYNGQGINSSSSHQQDYKMNEYAVACILPLCVTVYDTLIIAEEDLTHQFNAIAPTNATCSFPSKLREIVRKICTPDRTA